MTVSKICFYLIRDLNLILIPMRCTILRFKEIPAVDIRTYVGGQLYLNYLGLYITTRQGNGKRFEIKSIGDRK